MKSLFKKYLDEAFTAVTALGTAYFYTIIIILLILLNYKKTALHLTVGLLILYAMVFAVRIFYFRERPNREKYYGFITRLTASSFPSLHTINSIFTASVLSQIVSRNLSIFLYIIALLVAYSRVHIKKHYWSDVMAGIVIGTAAALIYLVIW